MSRSATIISVLVFLLLVLLGFWLSQNLVKKEIILPVGLQGEAARNPLLAAERFLTTMGVPTRPIDSIKDMQEKPRPGDVLLISSDRQTLGERHSQALLDWVKAGGHLVVTVAHVVPEEYEKQAEDGPLLVRVRVRDPLLDALGLSVRYLLDKDQDERVSRARLPGHGKELQVQFNPAFFLHGARRGDFVIDTGQGIALLQRRLGRGRITVLSGMHFLEFRRLGEYDHARFLYALVENARHVWLMSSNDMPPLWRWLWDHAREAVIAAALLLLLWLWSKLPRFGPLQQQPPPVRRRIMEHIEANGHFLWKQRQLARLVEAVREALEHTALHRHPAWAGMSAEEKVAHIAQLGGLGIDEARQLLGLVPNEPVSRHHREFTRLIEKLERIRKRL